MPRKIQGPAWKNGRRSRSARRPGHCQRCLLVVSGIVHVQRPTRLARLALSRPPKKWLRPLKAFRAYVKARPNRQVLVKVVEACAKIYAACSKITARRSSRSKLAAISRDAVHG